MPTPTRRLGRLLLERPLDVLVPLGMVIAAVRAMIGAAALSGLVDRELPGILVWGWQIGTAVGSLMIITGLVGAALTRPIEFGNVARWKTVAAAGAAMSSSAFAIYAVVLIGAGISSQSTLTSWVAATMSVGFGLLCVSLVRDNRKTLRDLRLLADDGQ